MSQNCWEFTKCGREPGGAKVSELGVCPAAIENKVHGVNRGKNGGRSCWAITGTLCGGQMQGSFAMKHHNCLKCDFFSVVKRQEGAGFVQAVEIIKKLAI